MTKNKSRYTFLIPLLFFIGLTINGCGSSSSESTSTQVTPQPQRITNENMRGVDLLSREIIQAPSVNTSNTEISITLQDIELAEDKHYQFFINTDDDASTGYQFGNGVWDEVGADYLIEDGYLYKSTANDTTWGWEFISSSLSELRTDTTISVTIQKTLLDSLSTTINLGYIFRDINWDAETFYPQSTRMASYEIDNTSSSDLTPPTIVLNGAKAMRVTKGSTFYDPGVIAIDNVDGNITSQVVTMASTSAPIDTDTVGTKSIQYSVSDSAGNSTSILRAITVVDSPVRGIVIDGNTDDWADINELTSNSSGSIKVSENYDFLNILIEAENLGEHTQIFIDNDNNLNTGIQFSSGSWNFGGADYMIEDRDLSKSTNPIGWSWDYAVAPIDFIKTDKVIEIAILKSNLENLETTNSINIGFVSRDANWNIDREILPSTGLANFVLNEPLMYIPDNIRNQLCNNPTEVFYSDVTQSFTSGVEYKGRKYIKEIFTPPPGYGFPRTNLKSTNLDGTDEIVIFSSDDPNLSLVSLNGTLVFSAKSDATYPRGNPELYSINDQNQATQLGNYKAQFNAFIDDRHYGLYTFENSGTKLVSNIGGTLFQDRDRRQVFGFDKVQMAYEDGIAYYAYTLGQLQPGAPGILTNVGERIIGLINDSSGLKPVSLCN